MSGHNSDMKLFRIALPVLLAFAAVAVGADKVDLADLVKDPKKYDGKVLETTGKVADFKQKTSRAGNKYFTLTLIQGDAAKVNVYSQGEAAKEIKDGVTAKVVGVYRIEKKLGTMVFKNEIDVTKVKDKPNGIEIVPKG